MREALRGIHLEMQQVRSDVSTLRTDFREHVDDDKRVWHIVYRWDGAITFLQWAMGLGIPAILAALIALLVKHW